MNNEAQYVESILKSCLIPLHNKHWYFNQKRKGHPAIRCIIEFD